MCGIRRKRRNSLSLISYKNFHFLFYFFYKIAIVSYRFNHKFMGIGMKIFTLLFAIGYTSIIFSMNPSKKLHKKFRWHSEMPAGKEANFSNGDNKELYRVYTGILDTEDNKNKPQQARKHRIHYTFKGSVPYRGVLLGDNYYNYSNCPTESVEVSEKNVTKRKKLNSDCNETIVQQATVNTDNKTEEVKNNQPAELHADSELTQTEDLLGFLLERRLEEYDVNQHIDFFGTDEDELTEIISSNEDHLKYFSDTL